MSPILERGFRATQAQVDEVMALLDGLSEEQQRWKVAPDEWSALQIAQHLVLSEETVGSSAWAAARLRPHRLRALWLALALAALRAKVALPLPSPELDPDGEIPWPILRERWQIARNRARQELALRGASNRRRRVFYHPVIGALSAREVLTLARVHNAYHLGQLRAAVNAMAASFHSQK